jgi:hypothetical protein
MATVPKISDDPQEEDPTDLPPKDFAPGWREEPGDKIRIRLAAVGVRSNGEYDPYVIYTGKLVDGFKARIKDGQTDDEVAVHARRTQLRAKLENAELDLGDVVSIVYDGPPLGTARSERYRVAKRSKAGWVEVGYAGEPDQVVAEELVSDVPAGQEGLPPAGQLHRPPEEGDPGPDPDDPGRSDDDIPFR